MDNVQGCCRICLASCFKGQSLFISYNEEYLPEVIFNIAGIHISAGDGLPSTVCIDCANLLLQAQSIKRTCLSSEELLRSQLKTTFSEEERPAIELRSRGLGDNNAWSHLNENIFDSVIQAENYENLRQELDEYFETNPYSPKEESHQANEQLDQFSDSDQLSEDLVKEGFDRLKDEELEGPPQSFGCNFCSKRFTNRMNFKRHQKYHSQGKTKCPICPREFSHKSNLKRHLSVHREECGLICDQCGDLFGNSRELYEHLKAHNKASDKDRVEYVLDCELCSNKTTSLASHLLHMREKHSLEVAKPFKCSLCGMRFASKQGMYRHIDNIHENNRRNLRNRDRNFLCNTCGKKFYTNFHLEVHVRSHTGERPFQCYSCEKSFSQLSGLKMHTLIHTGEKPFACKICGKRFNQYGHVREHLLTHTDERPHICKICNHSFRVKGNLTAHMLIHTGKRPFSCESCGKSFIQRGKLQAHADKSHPESAKSLEKQELNLVEDVHL